MPLVDLHVYEVSRPGLGFRDRSAEADTARIGIGVGVVRLFRVSAWHFPTNWTIDIVTQTAKQRRFTDRQSLSQQVFVLVLCF